VVSPTGSHSPNHQPSSYGLQHGSRASVGNLANRKITCFINTKVGIQIEIVKVSAKFFKDATLVDRVKEFFGFAQRVWVNLDQNNPEVKHEILLNVSSLFQRFGPLKGVNIAEEVAKNIQGQINPSSLNSQNTSQKKYSDMSLDELVNLARQSLNQLPKEELKIIRDDFEKSLKDVLQAKSNQSKAVKFTKYQLNAFKKMTQNKEFFKDLVAVIQSGSVGPNGENPLALLQRLFQNRPTVSEPKTSATEIRALEILKEVLDDATPSKIELEPMDRSRNGPIPDTQPPDINETIDPQQGMKNETG
jgi:hypothetical protein